MPPERSDRPCAYADWYVTIGVHLTAEIPDIWPDEKINGFSDYLAQAQREKAATND